MNDHTRLLSAAQEALRAGRKQEGRKLLQQATRQNPQDYRAWLWLAGTANSPQESLACLARAEKLKPGDPTIAHARTWAEKQLAETARKPAAKTSAHQAVSNKPATREWQSQPQLAPATEDAIERLRTQAQETPKEARRNRKPFVILVTLILFLCSAVAGLWLWNNADHLLAQNPFNAEQVAEAFAPTATGAVKVEEEATAEQFVFVSGQFEPRLAAAAPAEEAQPTPTATTVSLNSKPISADQSVNEARPTWTVTPSPTITPSPTPTPVPTFVSNDTTQLSVVLRPPGVEVNERWIDVNLSTQRLVAYEGNTPVFNTLISSGTSEHPTVTGQFRVWLRFTAQTMDGRRLGYDYYLPNVPYVMYFYQDYALHGTFWHNNFGTPMSHGCVNLPTSAAEWIFNWSRIGTLVNVHY